MAMQLAVVQARGQGTFGDIFDHCHTALCDREKPVANGWRGTLLAALCPLLTTSPTVDHFAHLCLVPPFDHFLPTI